MSVSHLHPSHNSMGRKESEGDLRDRHHHDDRQNRNRERDRNSRRDDPPAENWKDLRIKEEPQSDVEGRRERRGSRDRSNERTRSARHQDRDRQSGQSFRNNARERRSRSRDNRDDRERRRFSSREREDRRGQSPSPNSRRRRSPPRHNRSPQNNSRQPRNRDGRPAREQDWDNFFNPNTKIKKEKPEEDEHSKYGKKGPDGKEDPKKEKEKPNFGLSGKLTEETNTYRGVVIKYSEPPEARKPQRVRWRLYPFKGEEALPVMYIHRQSAYLLGRERKIADIPIDHPSCSKQHAVIQFRLVPYERPNGTSGRRIKPYVIDLESGNGTFVNGVKIDPKRYVELFEKDVLKFGFSTREYVLLHENSKADADADEPLAESPEPDEKVRIKVEENNSED